ncbi:MAG: hypothetical protein OEP48_02740 [Betaproteobacteria bacterium]|nr:hypothetical protein [Betaproteobacteria bacterium]MDH3435894.1 hypothetical protein [Betaproteobacteria bacterium]
MEHDDGILLDPKVSSHADTTCSVKNSFTFLLSSMRAALQNAEFSDTLRALMLNGAKRFVLLLALVMLPVQSIAAALSGIVCDAGSDEPTAHVAHANDGHDHGAQRDSHPDDDGANVQHEHSSCHYWVFILPAVTLPAGLLDSLVWASPSHGLPDLFVPDRPQRPPLA